MKRIIQLFSRLHIKSADSNLFLLKTKKTEKSYVCNFADDYYNDQRCICVDK